MLIFLCYLILLASVSLFLLFSLCFHTASRSFSNKVTAISLSLLLKLLINLILGPLALSWKPLHQCGKRVKTKNQKVLGANFYLNRSYRGETGREGLFAPSPPHLLIQNRLNVNFAPVSVCQGVNVVRSVFCYPYVSFLAKPLFTTVNLVHPVTVYNVKSVNWAHHICRVFPSVHCTTSICWHFSYQRHGNVTSFSLSSSNLLSHTGIKSHLLPYTLKLNLSPRPSFPPGISSSPNFQHVSSSIKICLFLMTLSNASLLNQQTQ